MKKREDMVSDLVERSLEQIASLEHGRQGKTSVKNRQVFAHYQD